MRHEKISEFDGEEVEGIWLPAPLGSRRASAPPAQRSFWIEPRDSVLISLEHLVDELLALMVRGILDEHMTAMARQEPGGDPQA